MRFYAVRESKLIALVQLNLNQTEVGVIKLRYPDNVIGHKNSSHPNLKLQDPLMLQDAERQIKSSAN